jgi:hypothetical protein
MKYWVINYLSPFYLLMRLFFLAGAGMAWIVLQSMANPVVTFIITAALIFNAIRPWKIGKSWHELTK